VEQTAQPYAHGEMGPHSAGGERWGDFRHTLTGKWGTKVVGGRGKWVDTYGTLFAIITYPINGLTGEGVWESDRYPRDRGTAE